MEKFIVIGPYSLPQDREETTAVSRTTRDCGLFEMGNVQGVDRGTTPPYLSTLAGPRKKGQKHFQGRITADRSCESGNQTPGSLAEPQGLVKEGVH